MRHVRHPQSLGFSILAGCAILFAGTHAAAVPLPAFHGVAPFGPYVAHLDPLPLEPAPPDYVMAPPFIPIMFPGVDAVANPLDPWHWEVEFMNPNLIAVGPFFAVLTVPGLPPGMASVVVGPIVLAPGAATGALIGPAEHIADPVGITDLGAFTVTVTNGLPAPINFDFVLIEWDPVMPPGTSGLPPAPPVVLPPGPAVTFAIVPTVMPPPPAVPSLGPLGLVAAGLSLLAAAILAIQRGASTRAGV